MKRDWVLYISVLILIVMVGTLIVISLGRQDKAEQAIQMINDLRSEPQKMPSVIHGTTPKLGVDYFNGKDAEKPKDGASAYEIAVRNGFVGSEKEWSDSLKPKDPEKPQLPKDGKNNYELALENGFTGSVTDYLSSLQGGVGAAARELDITCLGGVLGKRYAGDFVWQTTNIKCEVVHD